MNYLCMNLLKRTLSYLTRVQVKYLYFRRIWLKTNYLFRIDYIAQDELVAYQVVITITQFNNEFSTRKLLTTKTTHKIGHRVQQLEENNCAICPILTFQCRLKFGLSSYKERNTLLVYIYYVYAMIRQ